MSRYITPLPGFLATAIERALDQAIRADAGAVQRLGALEKRCIQLTLSGTGIDLYFLGQHDGHNTGLQIVAESDLPPDTVIRGSPAALLAMAVPDWLDADSGVKIEGDAGAAQALEKLMRRLDPDWEQLLTRQLGDVVGHQVWRALRDTLSGSRRLAGVAGDQIGHYLREESGLLVTRTEAQAFTRDVDELREAVDRLEVNLRRKGLA
ncbi:MAG TPA: SCP2 sterol-binding domain-containing protein [Wenzhouxiangella sp.]|nr:SCP2 sterol-binding domain-containing protein [Wenzhouxiangella sp.]